MSVDDFLHGCGLPPRHDVPPPAVSAPVPAPVVPPRAPPSPRFYTTLTPSVFRWYVNSGERVPGVYDFRFNHPNAAAPAVWPQSTDLFHGAMRSGIAPHRYSDAAHPSGRAPRTSERGTGLARWALPPPSCHLCGLASGPGHRCVTSQVAPPTSTPDVGFMVRSPNGTYLCGCGYAVRYGDRCYNRCGACGAQLYDEGPPRYHPLDAVERGRVIAYVKSWRASAGIVDRPANLTGRKFTAGERAHALARAAARSPAANADRLVAPFAPRFGSPRPSFIPGRLTTCSILSRRAIGLRLCVSHSSFSTRFPVGLRATRSTANSYAVLP